ncbi:MAG: hypothetical protein EP330_21940 [Deltaproteobacteria bacterium]|nr:MAG: hypothetical protein EP330_21940 [Deltaproteobacteria bacterium]
MRALVLGLLVLTTPALAKKRVKADPAPEVPPIPAALSLPADRAPVYAHVDEAPALLGSNLDLRSLARTKLTWTIGMDLAFLETLDHDLVIRQLAADPRWRVAREEGGLVAVRRQADAQTWTMRWHGYDVQPGRCTRTAYTFEPRTRQWAWSENDLVSFSSTDKSEHKVHGVRLTDDACRGQMGTALVVRGGIQLEVFESGDTDDRPWTIGELEGITGLHEIPFSGKLIREKGYSRRMLPEGAIRRDHSSFELRASPSGLELEAWQNPGAAGWTWLRILDEKLQVWEEAAVATATLERIGHSPDAAEHFLMQAEIPLPAGPAFAGTAEIWFVPDGDKKPVRVDSAPIQIPAR